MKCKWCPYIATESLKKDNTKRELFDDLKKHVREAHVTEYRAFERQAWGSAMETGRKLKKIRERQKELD